MNLYEPVFYFDNGSRTFRTVMWPVAQYYFSNIVQSKCSFSWNLDTKFCLHAAGGIYVNGNFEHWEGNTEISGSSAQKNGGAVLRISSLGLWQDFEMGVGLWGSTPWSEIEKT